MSGDDRERRAEETVDHAQLLKQSIEFQAKHSMAQDAIAFFARASGGFLSWCLIVTGFGLAIYFGTYGALDATILFGAAGAYGTYRLVRGYLLKRERR